MLNELLEYEQYQFSYYGNNPDTPFRITRKNLADHFVGVPHALEIIARHEIFRGKEPIDISKDTEQIENVFKSWLDKLLKSDQMKYLYLHKKRKKKNGKISDAYDELDEFIDHFKKNSIEKKFENYKKNFKNSDINASSYDRAIAQAYNRGALRNYILVQEGNPFTNVYRRENRNAKPASLNKGLKLYDHRDYILKFTAYYLLEKKPWQTAVPLYKQLLYNWSSQVNPVRYYCITSENEEYDIFEEISLNVCNKFKPYEPWIRCFSLVDITDPGSLEKWIQDPDNKDKIYYMDKGAHVNLERHIVADEVK